MSHAKSSSTFDQLSDRIEAGTERLFQTADTDPADETLSTTAAELWDVVAELEDLLETVDLEKLPDTVELSALPELLDLAELPDAIRDRDADRALDLGALRHAIKLRGLWNTVDLVDFQRELKQLRDELEDVVDLEALESGGDSESATAVKEFVDEVKPDATNAAIQQQVKAGAATARKAVVEGHAAFETLYESTQRGPGYAGRRPVSKNPTAVSSVPYGPLPASVSTRVSTVPANVRGAAVNAPSRIYARRWRTVDRST